MPDAACLAVDVGHISRSPPCKPVARAPPGSSLRLPTRRQPAQATGSGPVHALVPIVPANPIARRGIGAHDLADHPALPGGSVERACSSSRSPTRRTTFHLVPSNAAGPIHHLCSRVARHRDLAMMAIVGYHACAARSVVFAPFLGGRSPMPARRGKARFVPRSPRTPAAGDPGRWRSPKLLSMNAPSSTKCPAPFRRAERTQWELDA